MRNRIGGWAASGCFAILLLGGCKTPVRIAAVQPVAPLAEKVIQENATAPGAKSAVSAVGIEISGAKAMDTHLSDQFRWLGTPERKPGMFESGTFYLASDQTHATTLHAVLTAALAAEGIRSDDAANKQLRVEIEELEFDMMSSEMDRIMSITLDIYVWCDANSAVLYQRKIQVENIQEADQTGQQALDALGVGSILTGLDPTGISGWVTSGARIAASETQKQSEILAFETAVYEALAEIAAEVRRDPDLVDALRSQIVVKTGDS